MINPANLASVGGGGAMYAVTAGSENSVNSGYTSDAATSRSVVMWPLSGGTPSVHRLSIDFRIVADGSPKVQWLDTRVRSQSAADAARAIHERHTIVRCDNCATACSAAPRAPAASPLGMISSR